MIAPRAQSTGMQSKGEKKRKTIPRIPKTKEEVPAVDLWSGTTQGSHLTTPNFIYLPEGRILIQGMLDHLSRMASRTYESTRSIDFAFLHRIGVREEFFRLTSRVGFTIPFWTIHDSCPAYDSATIEIITMGSYVTCIGHKLGI
jgi:hypothetical protein